MVHVRLNIGVERLGMFIMFEYNANFYPMEIILIKNSCIWFTFSKWKIGNSMAIKKNIFYVHLKLEYEKDVRSWSQEDKIFTYLILKALKEKKARDCNEFYYFMK